MFYKLIYNESDKRKKIDTNTQTFEGLTAFARKVFKLEDKDVGFLFLGQDDVSAYEISCDEDLEYVLEVSKTFSSNSKFVLIKVIENFETSPENPDKFSHVDSLEEENKGQVAESFDNLSSAISKSKLQEEALDLRNDLEAFDEKIIQKNEEEKEDQEMIENIDKMIEHETVNVEDADVREMIEEKINEEVYDIENLKEDMNQIEITEEVVQEEKEVPVVPKKEKKVVKKAKKIAKKIAKKKKKLKKMIKDNNIKDLASHLTESININSAEQKDELESKIGDLLNATLSQINLKFEEKQKKMDQKKNKKAIRIYHNFCRKVKKKMAKFNKKMGNMYEDILPEARANIAFDTIVWSNQATGFNSMENESLKFEIDRLAAEKFQSMDQMDHLTARVKELENLLAAKGNTLPVVEKPKRNANVSVETVHWNIICDGCNKKNFKGRRYKCMIRPDFDLCEDCEATQIHSHPMIRLTTNDVNTRKLNWGLKMLRERPRFQKLFNLVPTEDNETSDEDRKRRCHRKKMWWMKKMFGGKAPWKKHCKKRSQSTSSSSSSDDSNSPQKKGHRHPKRMFRKFANNIVKNGHWWMNKMMHGKHRPGPHHNKSPWFIDFSKHNEMNKEMNECGRPFPGFMGGHFGRKNKCEKRVKKCPMELKKEEVKNTVEKNLENKKPEEIVPAQLKETLNKMGVDIVDCYVSEKGASNESTPLGPNDIKIEIDIPAPEKKPETEEKVDLMTEDKIIRKKSEKVNEEDFVIECETPKKALSSEEMEIKQRKEYVRMTFGEMSINDEVLHYFVTSNLDLDRERFYNLMNEQKKFLVD
jgi:hypothetical protein